MNRGPIDSQRIHYTRKNKFVKREFPFPTIFFRRPAGSEALRSFTGPSVSATVPRHGFGRVGVIPLMVDIGRIIAGNVKIIPALLPAKTHLLPGVGIPGPVHAVPPAVELYHIPTMVCLIAESRPRHGDALRPAKPHSVSVKSPSVLHKNTGSEKIQ